MSTLATRLRVAPALALTLLATALSGCGPSNLVNGVTNPLSFGICGLIVIVLDIVALVEVWKSTRSDGDKLIWTGVIVILPFVGMIAYYLFGRK